MKLFSQVYLINQVDSIPKTFYRMDYSRPSLTSRFGSPSTSLAWFVTDSSKAGNWTWKTRESWWRELEWFHPQFCWSQPDSLIATTQSGPLYFSLSLRWVGQAKKRETKRQSVFLFAFLCLYASLLYVSMLGRQENYEKAKPSRPAINHALNGLTW